MKSFIKTSLAVALSAMALSSHAAELRVIVHDSFDLPKPLLESFQKTSGITLKIIKGGDAGEMVNKLILTKNSPIADVVYGVDNTLIGKAEQAGILEHYTPTAEDKGIKQQLPGAASVDYGYVTLNYDKAWFAKHGVALPTSLDDLTKPAYHGLLVVENPATSSPGLAFLLSTIKGMGEKQAFAWWAKVRDNGMKVTKDWSQAYNTQFSRNGGAYPIVVSYATSPAAEVFYSKEKLTQSPTGNLFLKGAVFQQVEGAALLKGGKEPEAARRFISFLRSADVQKAIGTSMWMYPVVEATPLETVYQYAQKPATAQTPDAKTITGKGVQWVNQWTKLVLKSGY